MARRRNGREHRHTVNAPPMGAACARCPKVHRDEARAANTTAMIERHACAAHPDEGIAPPTAAGGRGCASCPKRGLNAQAFGVCFLRVYPVDTSTGLPPFWALPQSATTENFIFGFGVALWGRACIHKTPSPPTYKGADRAIKPTEQSGVGLSAHPRIVYHLVLVKPLVILEGGLP